jgi:ABC-type Zn uptake system ZnuABC Zn-binding protein ZnuA
MILRKAGRGLATGVAAALVLALVLALVPGVAAAASKRSLVAAFYPVAYAAQRVGGDRVDVTNLTPAGAEPHDLELNPDQIDKILDADLVVDLGQGFQPAVEKAAGERDGPTVSRHQGSAHLARPGANGGDRAHRRAGPHTGGSEGASGLRAERASVSR